MNMETAGEAETEALMRTIVVLLIAALVLTPTLAHAQVNGGLGYVGLAILMLPGLLILLLMDGDEEYPRAAETPSPLPGPPSESQSSTVPAPAGGSDR